MQKINNVLAEYGLKFRTVVTDQYYRKLLERQKEELGQSNIGQDSNALIEYSSDLYDEIVLEGDCLVVANKEVFCQRMAADEKLIKSCPVALLDEIIIYHSGQTYKAIVESEELKMWVNTYRKMSAENICAIDDGGAFLRKQYDEHKIKSLFEKEQADQELEYEWQKKMNQIVYSLNETPETKQLGKELLKVLKAEIEAVLLK